MRKYLALLSVLIFLFAVACKKSEEQQPAQRNTKPAAGRSARKHKATAAPIQLDIYQEDQLVKSLPADEYKGLTSKVKVGDKEVDGVLLKDILAKYNLKGKTVVVSGPQRSAQLSWDQANSRELYLILGAKQFLQISAPKTLNVPFPNRVIRITATSKPQSAAATKTGK